MIEENIKGKIGKDILIELRSNPTTGYKWHVISSEGLTVTEQYIPAKSKKGMCGVGGIEQLKISSMTGGTFKLRIAYKRGWEEDEEDVREYTLTFE